MWVKHEGSGKMVYQHTLNPCSGDIVNVDGVTVNFGTGVTPLVDHVQAMMSKKKSRLQPSIFRLSSLEGVDMSILVQIYWKIALFCHVSTGGDKLFPVSWTSSSHDSPHITRCGSENCCGFGNCKWYPDLERSMGLCVNRSYRADAFPLNFSSLGEEWAMIVNCPDVESILLSSKSKLVQTYYFQIQDSLCGVMYSVGATVVHLQVKVENSQTDFSPILIWQKEYDPIDVVCFLLERNVFAKLEYVNPANLHYVVAAMYVPDFLRGAGVRPLSVSDTWNDVIVPVLANMDVVTCTKAGRRDDTIMALHTIMTKENESVF